MMVMTDSNDMNDDFDEKGQGTKTKTFRIMGMLCHVKIFVWSRERPCMAGCDEKPVSIL